MRLSERLARAAPAERRQILDRVVRMVIGSVLKVAPSRRDPRKAMGAMGLNSLMAMEMRNRLEAELQRPLSATLAWNYPTIETLVAHLAGSEPASADGPDKKSDVGLSSHVQEVMHLSEEQALAALRDKENALTS